MALPKAAQKQLEEAERLHAEVYQAEEAETDEKPAEEKPDLKEVSAEQPTAEAQQEETPPPAPPAEVSTEDDSKWEHKYKVLKGKYDAEVPRLQQQNNSLQSQMTDLRAEMNARLADLAKPQDETPEQTAQRLLNAEEIEDYGEEMIDVVKRAAREEVQPELQSLRKENEQLKQLLGGMQDQTAITARDQMLSQLDAEQTDWREINQNPQFLAWLETVDPFSGARRLDLLRQAFENNNTQRVLAFFRGYLNENAVTSPNTQSEPSTPQVGLETLVAPGQPAGGDSARAQEGNTANGRKWSQQDISAFYRDVNRGVYMNDPAERERLERDIFLAQQEGRIVF